MNAGTVNNNEFEINLHLTEMKHDFHLGHNIYACQSAICFNHGLCQSFFGIISVLN